MQSLADLGEAFEDAFAFLGQEVGPANSVLLQVPVSESESDSSSSDSDDDDSNLQLREDGLDVTMDCTSNNKDSGKLSGYSPDDSKITQIFDSYTGADNDEFMNDVI